MKLHNIFKTVAGVLLLLGASACTDEVKFEPTAPVSGEGLYFSTDQGTTVDIEENATTATIEVFRTNAEGTYTANITSSVTDAEGNTVSGVLTVPATVTFSAGQLSAPLEIGVDFANVEMEKVYYVHLALDAAQASPYGDVDKTFELSYAPWTEWEVIANESDPGYYQQNSIWDYLYPTYVYFRQSLTNPNRSQYAVDSPFSDLDYQYMWEMDKSYTVEVNGVECYRCVGLDYVNSTVNSSNGVPYLFSEYSWWMINVIGGWTWPELVARYDSQDNPQSYYNPVEGRFYIKTIVWDNALEPGYAYSNNYETLQLPGDYKDYFITISYTGNYVDTKGAESAVINITRSEDVSSYSYVVLPGALTEEEAGQAVADMVQDPDMQLYYDYSLNVAVECETEGDYTVVAVGFNESGAQVCTAAETFTYNSVQKETDYVSIGWCEYTDGLMWGIWTFEDGSYLGGETWEVEVERHKTNPNLYRLVNPYYDFATAYGFAMEGNYYINFEIFPQLNNAVVVYESELGVYDPSERNPTSLSVFNYGGYFCETNDPADVVRLGWAGKMVDNVITFPAGTFMLLVTGTDSGYYSNKNESMLGIRIDTNKLPTGYGTGKLKIDLSYVDLNKAPSKNKAKLAPRKAGKLVAADTVVKANIKVNKGVKTSIVKDQAKNAKAGRVSF